MDNRNKVEDRENFGVNKPENSSNVSYWSVEKIPIYYGNNC